MKAKRLHNLVSKLGIVAHGDKSGVIELDKQMSIATIAGFAVNLLQLNKFLVSEAELIFFSCIAGNGKEGIELLKRISSILDGRYVIGFTIKGAIAGKVACA